jgi:hypothetical protein
VAERIEVLGVAKARLPLASVLLLAVLAGAYIGFGSLFFLLVISDPSWSFTASRVLGGLVFSLGLLTVVVAGAELFTGNHLLAMAWADGRLRTGEVLRNWAVVCAGNALGAGLLAWAVAGADLGLLNGGRLAQQAMKVAQAKADLPADVAFLRGVLCNVLVCLAVWMAAAGRSVVDMTPETMGRLAKHPNIVGVKDATANLARPLHQRAACGNDFIQLSGEDHTALSFNAAGGHGCISVTSNIAPRLCAEMHKAWREGRVCDAMMIQDRLLPVHDALFCETSPGPVKYAASLLGRGSAYCRPPMAPIAASTATRVEAAMRGAGLLN